MKKLSYIDTVFITAFVAILIFGMNLAVYGGIGNLFPKTNVQEAAAVTNVTALSSADKSSINQMAVASLGAPTNKTFYLFNADTRSNENQTHIPPDTFTPDVITVNKGDTVNIIFYNTEPAKGGDPHSFTIGAPYDLNVMVNPGQHSTIKFKADTAGAFQFYCSMHLPTMRGELLVLPS